MSHISVEAPKLVVPIQAVCRSCQMGECCKARYLLHELMMVASCGQ